MGRWESLTHGHKGMFVKAPALFGVPVDSVWKLYLLTLALALIGTLAARNLTAKRRRAAWVSTWRG